MARLLYVLFSLSILHFVGTTQSVKIEGALVVSESSGAPDPGTIRWTGTDFEGWTGKKWLSLSAGNTVYDASGNSYTAIKIGNQTWLDHNLHTLKYNDGTDIPLATNVAEWKLATQTNMTGIMCWYEDNQAANEFPYGALYNFYAIDTLLNGNKNVCPIGFHVPDKEELDELKGFLIALGAAGGQLKVAGTTYWTLPNTGANNAFGFSSYPAGRRGPSGTFAGKGLNTYLRTTTEAVNTVNAQYGLLSHDDDQFDVILWNRGIGMSIRCLKN